MTEMTPQSEVTAERDGPGWDRIALIGAGTIGASWAALFLATGRGVTVHDPGVDETTVRSAIESTAPTLSALGLPVENLTARLRFAAELEKAVSDVDVVQENGPENFDFKRELWARVEHAVKPATLLLSSASGLTASRMGVDMKDPGRLVVGHPFNPPHLIPLVEVVPSPSTPPTLVDEVVAFYGAVGKRPFVIRQEIRAFVANRLQMALLRECIHLVSSGVVAMTDLDEIVTSSIGLRWAVAGPFQTFHLGGGPGGLAEFLDKFGPRMNELWSELGSPQLDPPTVQRLKDELARSYGQVSMAELESRRDDQQVKVMRALGLLPGTPRPPAPRTGATKREELVGTWQLARWENVVDGMPQDSALGARPRGQIIYTANGQMSAILSSADRVPLGAAAFHLATPEEQAAAAAGYISYGGTWDLTGDLVVHHCTFSLFPNWVGTDLVRGVEWEGDRLALVAAVQRPDGATAINKLVWQRVDT
jgi:ketoreductase RED1